MVSKNILLVFFFTFLIHGIGKKRWLFSIGNGAEIRPLEKGSKCPEVLLYFQEFRATILTFALSSSRTKNASELFKHSRLSLLVSIEHSLSWI